MLLSIIVPVYNVEEYLGRCIESLVDQNLDYTDYEIILINDGSTDSSLTVANKYKDSYKNIQIFTQENLGLSEARNVGINKSEGEFILFVDSDDYIEINVLQKLLNAAKIKDLDVLGFNYIRTSKSDCKSEIVLSETELSKSNITTGMSFISNHNYSNGAWWYIVKKNILFSNNISFEKGRMVEDILFTTEVLLKSNRVSFIDSDIYKYYKNNNSILTKKDKKHLNKLIDDYLFVVNKFKVLIDFAKEKNADTDNIIRLKARQESYAFFLFIRMIKANTSYSYFSFVISEMKKIKVYPIRNFIGVDYNSKELKILTFIVNNKLLLFSFLVINNILRIIK